MAEIEKKVNFNHKNGVSKDKVGRKRTVYNIEEDKLNLVEVRRKMNK